MTASLTLHSMNEELATALRLRAEEIGESMNRTAQDLLSAALGLVTASQPACDMRDCFGYLKKNEAAALLTAVGEQDVIDEAMWK